MSVRSTYLVKEVSIWDWKIKVFDFGDVTDDNAIYIQGQLHSNEVNSFSTLHCLIEKFKINPPPIPLRIIPSCNPIGWDIYLNGNDGRVSYPGKLDWNRLFHAIPPNSETVEIALAYELWKLSEGFNEIIDVHTPDFGFAHVYSCNLQDRLLTFDDLPYAISDKIIDGTFQNLNAVERNIRSFTLELPSNNVWTISDQEYWSERIYKELITIRELSAEKSTLPKYFGKIVPLYSKISGISIQLVEPNKVYDKQTDLVKVLSENGDMEIISFNKACIPLCYRRRGLIPAGRMVIKVLSLDDDI